ncbi:MAG TPA: hypothetical protein VL524_08450 [Gemmatimonadaceae bacterium]|jgi:hypothetical protein|nr:hypothetical protein [Gemmatimonadaceae bacterium]
MKTSTYICLLSVAVVAVTAAPRAAPAQEGAGLVMPTYVLHQIALDFDQGRNPFYCYFGTRSPSTPDQVRVDSVTTVATPTDCAGNGLGFVSRVDDRFFLINTLKGLIDAMPRFLVVSAFYRTEDLEHDGFKVHTAHALSIIRGVGVGTTASNGRS